MIAERDETGSGHEEPFRETRPGIDSTPSELSGDTIGSDEFRLLADHIPVLCWIAHGDGSVDWHNRRWHDYCGTTPEAMQGLGWQKVHDPELLPAVTELWTRSIATGEPFEMTYPLKGADGMFRPFLTRVQPVRGASGAIVRWFGVNAEVTVHSCAEPALAAINFKHEELSAEQAAILGQLEEGVILTDAEGRIIFVNDAAARLHGVKQLDVEPDGYSETYRLFTENGEPYPFEQLPLARAVLRGETVADARWRIRRPDGSEILAIGTARPLMLAGRQAGSVLTMRDDTDRSAAEAALRESEARFRAMADSAPAPVWVSKPGGIAFANKAFGALAGMPPEQITGEVWIDMIHPDDRSIALERRAEAWKTGSDYAFAARFRETQGAYRWMQVSCRPRHDATGAMLGYVGIAFDVTDMRATEAALRESESRFREVFENAGVGMIEIDADWNILNSNLVYREIAGRAEQDLLGANCLSFTHSDDIEVGKHALRSLAAGETERISFEKRYLRPDGGVVWVRSNLSRVSRGAGADRFLKIVEDITAVRLAREALSEESRRLQTLNRVGASLAGQLHVELIVQMVTDAGRELTDAAIGAFFYNVVDPQGDAYMLYALSGADRAAFDKFPMPRKTAIFGPTFDGEGVVRSADITQDPRYGQSDTHFGMPKDHLPVVSYLAVPVVSRSGEVIGGLFYGHPEPGRFTQQHEQLLVGVAGQAAVAIDNARLFEAARRELGERTRAEEALRALNETLEQRVAGEVERRAQTEEALRQAQKMETLGQLTGGVAHDFNNLLQIVSGNVGLIQRGLPEDAGKLRRAADNAARGAERAAVLTQRLLAFSRRQPLAPKQIDPNKLVGGMSDLLHRTLGETIEVETVLAPRAWPIEADPNQLENAILNLAINARDAMPEGGKLTIETCNTHLDRGYVEQNAEVTAGQYVCICVSDTGAGMDQATVTRAFEPFFTTKEVGKGTGLGLSMVYGFVKQSGGHLKIYSERNEGTTVKIYLPRLVGERPDTEPAGEAIVPEGTQSETILVCEDDDDVRVYTVEVLRELGYRVLEAHDGPAALSLIERPGEIDLLFTDVVLPGGMSGAALAREAHQLRPELRVLFTTGYARNAIVHHGRLDPGVELITKPFSYADLAARVRDMLDGQT